MGHRRTVTASVVTSLLLFGACTAERSGETAAPPTDDGSTSGSPAGPASTAEPDTVPPTSAPPTATTRPPATTSPDPTTSTTRPPKRTTTTTRPPQRTTTTTTTTTLPPAVAGAHNPKCVVLIWGGDSLSLIADRVGRKGVTVGTLQRENGIVDANQIEAGDLLDVCPHNKINDIEGGKRKPPPPPPPPVVPPSVPVTGSGVAAQQEKLNQLFGGLGLPALTVDGDSGRLTEQALCAARLALNLPVSRADMEPGGLEEVALLSAGGLTIPAGAPTWASRWALIDQTCEIMFVGEGSSRIVFAFPTSTGEPGYETRPQNGSPVFRFDPALENGGWHNSIDYPVPGDNPLNGNMYKPLYFDSGQAIHGANNVPTDPQSKGCARLRVEHQEMLVGWLGLQDAGGPIWEQGDINLVVSVQGSYY